MGTWGPNLAKVGVEGSNPFARSIFFQKSNERSDRPRMRSLWPEP